VIGLLGRGGMGEVYRADDLRLGQAVALKFLPKDLAADARRLAQFHNEVRTARQVSHPNVCRVYDIGEIEGDLYLSMEYVDGEDLAASLKRIGRFPEDRAIEIARQLAGARRRARTWRRPSRSQAREHHARRCGEGPHHGLRARRDRRRR
jgi:serine/threonine-protein kinase